MFIGTRVLHPEEVGLWHADLLQISVYRGMRDNIRIMKNCAQKCRDKGIRYVVHPVSYSVLDGEIFKELKVMAEWADLALILHDEKTPEGKRIDGQNEKRFRHAIDELCSSVHVSFENAADTKDIHWFWDNYADSVTLDIGHVESAGLDSIEFVKSLEKDVIKKIQFVHMHRNNGWHGGISDHWPLLPDCRELTALGELIRKKPDVSVILELNETEMIEKNIELIKQLGDELSR